MGSKQLLLGSSLVATLVLTTATSGFSQVQPAQNRIPQQVLINGQRVNAVNVAAPGGGFQAYTCLNPQQYASADGSSQGWACYEQATGVWILNALPPAQVQQPQPQVQVPQPQVQVPQPQPQVQLPQPPAPLPQPQVHQPSVIYPQQPPMVIYQQPPVIYQQPPVVYQQPPMVIYTSPVYPAPPVVVAPAYPASVVLGTAAIDAAARIVSSAIIGSRYPRVYYAPVRSYPVRVWRR